MMVERWLPVVLAVLASIAVLLLASGGGVDPSADVSPDPMTYEQEGE